MKTYSPILISLIVAGIAITSRMVWFALTKQNPFYDYVGHLFIGLVTGLIVFWKERKK